MECKKCGEELKDDNKCTHCDTSCGECCGGEDKEDGEEDCDDCGCDCQ